MGIVEFILGNMIWLLVLAILGFIMIILLFFMINMFLDMFFDTEIKDYIEIRKKRKEEKREKKKYNKSVKKLSKEDKIQLKELAFEYSNYISIIDKILENVCSKEDYQTNNLYLLKLDEYISNDYHVKKFSIEGISYLLKSIKEVPVINIKDEESFRKNIEVLDKLVRYYFPDKYLNYEKKIISREDAKNILSKLYFSDHR